MNCVSVSLTPGEQAIYSVIDDTSEGDFCLGPVLDSERDG